MKKTMHNWLIVSFSIIISIPLIGFATPLKVGNNPIEAQEVEKIEWNSLNNGEYERSVSNFLNDRIPFHNQMVWLKTNLDLLSGRKEINGVFITDKMLIKKPDLPSKGDCDKISNCITKVALKTQKKVYTMVFPTSAQVNKSYLPSTVPKADEGSFIGLIGQNAPKNVVKLDTSTPLTTTKGRNSFYNTDTRLTSYGAFCVYNYNVKQMGFTPASLKEFNIQYGVNDFYGNLYAKTFYTGIAPDKVNLYHYNTNKLNVTVDAYNKEKVEHRDKLFDERYLNDNDSVKSLTGEDAAVKVVKSDVDGNKQLVVFGDENFHPLLQFLAIHFSKITVVDLSRLTQKEANKVDLNGADQILFSYGIESITSNEVFKNIELLIN